MCQYDPQVESEAASSRDGMLLAHPPLGRLLIDTISDSDAEDAEITLRCETKDAGWTYGMLREYGPLTVGLAGPLEFFVDEALTWKGVADVDATTGFEMLKILRG